MNLIGIYGVTASGKSQVAINLARLIIDSMKKTVWIINCDSRQMYSNLNLGVGKLNGYWIDSKLQFKYLTNIEKEINQPEKAFVSEGIWHFLIDYVDIHKDKQYSLLQFLIDFKKVISKSKKIVPKSNQPDYIIITGGTGLYMRSLFEKYSLEVIKPQFKVKYNAFKARIINQNLSQLQQQYSNLNKEDFLQLSNSEINNSKRLINKILKITAKNNKWVTNFKIPSFSYYYKFLIETNLKELEDKLRKRIQSRIIQGLIEEVNQEISSLNQNQIQELGLLYKYLTENKISTRQDLNIGDINNLILCELKYAKKQLTWLNKEPGLYKVNNELEVFNYIINKTPHKG
jgi:tRNA A37 N6-isopentenylltransferase MiaA